MKKIFILFGLLTVFSSITFAYYKEGQTSDMDVLQKQGYSVSTLQIIDLNKYQQQGEGSAYERQYVPVKRDKRANRVYNAVKKYIDPIQDDGLFGEREIEFTNTWNGDKTKYSTQLIRKENL